MAHTEAYLSTATKLKRIAALSAADPEMVFTQVIHHFNEESLQTCFQELDGKKAIGIDGVDKASYGEKLTTNLRGLTARMKRMAYISGEYDKYKSQKMVNQRRFVHSALAI